MKRLRLPSHETLIRAACWLALFALPMMVWSIFDPRVWPVLVALSIGQLVGSTSFVLFLLVVARDLSIWQRFAKPRAEK